MSLIWKTPTPRESEKSRTSTTGRYKPPISEIAEVPQAVDSTWEEWEQTVQWQQSTIPGMLMEEDTTMPLPLELLPEHKY